MTIDTISMEMPILSLKGLPVNFFYKMMVFLSLKIVFIVANSAGPDEMLPYVAFHLGFHCVPITCLQVFRMQRVNSGVWKYHVQRERSGSVVECLTQDREAVDWSLTGVTALWSLSKTHLS